MTTDAVNGQHPAQQTSPLGGGAVDASTKAEFSPALAFSAAPQLVPVAVAEASTEQWVWVYLLLEFQSEPDPWMALRMMVYMGLLSQHPMAEVRNLAGALFGVEQSRTLKNTLDIMRTLDAMLDDPQMKPLRRTISTWFKLSRSTHPIGICNSDRQIHRRSI